MPPVMSRTHVKLPMYQAHVAECRACDRCMEDGMVNPAGSEHPSPWAMWMGSLDAKVVVVGQDFAGAESGHMKPDPTLPTNRNLAVLIGEAGLRPEDVYLTNSVLCLKPSTMSGPVRTRWVRNCRSHLARTIEIIRPRAVIALGGHAHRAVWEAAGRTPGRLADAVEAAATVLPDGTGLFAMNHPGGLGLVSRPLAQQRADWVRVGIWLRQTAAVAA